MRVSGIGGQHPPVEHVARSQFPRSCAKTAWAKSWRAPSAGARTATAAPRRGFALAAARRSVCYVAFGLAHAAVSRAESRQQLTRLSIRVLMANKSTVKLL